MKTQLFAKVDNDGLMEKKIWFNERNGYIIKSTYNPVDGTIKEEYQPYNQPSNLIQYINNYMKYQLK